MVQAITVGYPLITHRYNVVEGITVARDIMVQAITVGYLIITHRYNVVEGITAARDVPSLFPELALQV